MSFIQIVVPKTAILYNIVRFVVFMNNILCKNYRKIPSKRCITHILFIIIVELLLFLSGDVFDTLTGRRAEMCLITYYKIT